MKGEKLKILSKKRRKIMMKENTCEFSSVGLYCVFATGENLFGRKEMRKRVWKGEK